MWSRYGDGGCGVAFVIDSSTFQHSNITREKSSFFVNSDFVDYITSEQSVTDANDKLNRLLNDPTWAEVFKTFPGVVLPFLISRAPTIKHVSFF